MRLQAQANKGSHLQAIDRPPQPPREPQQHHTGITSMHRFAGHAGVGEESRGGLGEKWSISVTRTSHSCSSAHIMALNILADPSDDNPTPEVEELYS